MTSQQEALGIYHSTSYSDHTCAKQVGMFYRSCDYFKTRGPETSVWEFRICYLFSVWIENKTKRLIPHFHELGNTNSWILPKSLNENHAKKWSDKKNPSISNNQKNFIQQNCYISWLIQLNFNLIQLTQFSKFGFGTTFLLQFSRQRP